ncbi:hypothetical protein Tco_1253266 [Tanacetum coccineum]
MTIARRTLTSGHRKAKKQSTNSSKSLSRPLKHQCAALSWSSLDGPSLGTTQPSPHNYKSRRDLLRFAIRHPPPQTALGRIDRPPPHPFETRPRNSVHTSCKRNKKEIKQKPTARLNFGPGGRSNLHPAATERKGAERITVDLQDRTGASASKTSKRVLRRHHGQRWTQKTGNWKIQELISCEDEDMSLPCVAKRSTPFARHLLDFTEDKKGACPLMRKRYVGQVTGTGTHPKETIQTPALAVEQQLPAVRGVGRGNDKYTPQNMTAKEILATIKKKKAQTSQNHLQCATPEEQRSGMDTARGQIVVTCKNIKKGKINKGAEPKKRRTEDSSSVDVLKPRLRGSPSLTGPRLHHSRSPLFIVSNPESTSATSRRSSEEPMLVASGMVRLHSVHLAHLPEVWVLTHHTLNYPLLPARVHLCHPTGCPLQQRSNTSLKGATPQSPAFGLTQMYRL